ncbi:MAG: nucleotidyltransferase domain-containing protein [Chloroflexi bacterium]|nr:nucleotidyltransferase domain-containing protein [Chloroflexota bacterium]
MRSKALLSSTGIRPVDDVIARVVTTYREAFPGRAIGCYLIGSYADGTANDLSDVDLIMVCAGWTPDEEDRERERSIRLSLPTSVRVDVSLIPEGDLPASHVGVNVKLASLHLDGEDIRERLALPPLDAYRRQVAAGARYFMGEVLRGGSGISLPLRFPDPEDEFFGYARKRIAAWYPPSVEHGLKELVTTATRLATALVAVHGGRYVGSKGESVRLYREVVGDEWAGDLDLLYTKGKVEWGYLIPRDAADRRLLRELCARFLERERHFLAIAPLDGGI